MAGEPQTTRRLCADKLIAPLRRVFAVRLVCIVFLVRNNTYIWIVSCLSSACGVVV